MKLMQVAMPLTLIGARKIKPWIMENYGIDGLRGLFVSSIAGVLIMLAVVYSKIQARGDVTPVQIKKRGADGVERTELLTVTEYDLSELKKLFTRTLMGLFIGGFLHLKFNFDDPLLMQALMIPMQTAGSQLVKIYIGGAAAVGELARPFQEPNPLAALMQAGDQLQQEGNGAAALTSGAAAADDSAAAARSTATAGAASEGGVTRRKTLRST